MRALSEEPGAPVPDPSSEPGLLPPVLPLTPRLSMPHVEQSIKVGQHTKMHSSV